MTPEPKGKTGRGIKIALALSLALNLGVAGVLGGAALRMQGDEGRDGGRRAQRDISFAPFTAALTRDQRHQILQDMGSDKRGIRDMRAQLGSDLDAVLTSLRADPFDAAAVDAALARQGARLSARADAGRQALVSLIATMSDDERADYVRRLEKEVTRRPDRRKDR